LKPYISVQRRAKDYTAPRCFFRQPTGQNRPFNCRERLFRVGLRKNANGEARWVCFGKGVHDAGVV
jgi:hypothetical protein